jgi:hypothetical protein
MYTTPNIFQLSYTIQLRYCQVDQIRLNGSGNSPQLFNTLSGKKRSYLCIHSDYTFDKFDMYLGGTLGNCHVTFRRGWGGGVPENKFVA